MQAKQETARNMKNDGLAVSKIAEYTGLSEEEITQL
jgi:predicted transposase/invertase (TIGR01784 family)